LTLLQLGSLGPQHPVNIKAIETRETLPMMQRI
jgi:hypothetical protein